MEVTTLSEITAVTDPTYYTHERYLDRGRRGAAVRAFYTVRPLIPRSLQIAMRRVYARRQAKADFPRWPAEPVLVDLMHEDLRRRIHSNGGARAELVNFWPDGHRFACIVTHDVESAAGVANVERLREVERLGATAVCVQITGSDPLGTLRVYEERVLPALRGDRATTP